MSRRHAVQNHMCASLTWFYGLRNRGLFTAVYAVQGQLVGPEPGGAFRRFRPPSTRHIRGSSQSTCGKHALHHF